MSMKDPMPEGEEAAVKEEVFDADLAAFEPIAGDTAVWLVGRVVGILSYGAFVAVKPPEGGQSQARGLVHLTQIRPGFIEKIEDELLIGQEVSVRVLDVDTEGGKLSLSMKPAFIKQKPQKPGDLDPFFPLAGEDEWLDGVVAGLSKFGAFVDVESPEGTVVRGLVHVTELSDSIVENIAEFFEVGVKVRVRVISVDETVGRVSLTMRSMPPSRRKGQSLAAFEGFPADLWLQGKVIDLVNYGAFVELPSPAGAAAGPPAVGLVHISQVQRGFIEDVGEVLEIDQTVSVRVVGMDLEKGKLTLSMLSPDDAASDQAGEA